MDPRIAWPSPEQLGVANDIWTRIIEAIIGENVNYRQQHFTSFSNFQIQQIKKRENKASTYGLNHSSNKYLLAENGGLTPWTPHRKQYHLSVIGLDEEIKDFIEYISQSDEEIYMRNEVVRRIKDVVKELWAEAKMETFGSFRTGLWLPTRYDVLIKEG